MPTIEELLDDIFAGHERLSRDEIQRRAVAADLAARDLAVLDALPEGEYAQDGVDPAALDDETLLRELASLHRTRHETFLHASTQALQHHSQRTTELELEYLKRHPERQIDPERLRSGARQDR